MWLNRNFQSHYLVTYICLTQHYLRVILDQDVRRISSFYFLLDISLFLQVWLTFFSCLPQIQLLVKKKKKRSCPIPNTQSVQVIRLKPIPSCWYEINSVAAFVVRVQSLVQGKSQEPLPLNPINNQRNIKKNNNNFKSWIYIYSFIFKLLPKVMCLYLVAFWKAQDTITRISHTCSSLGHHHCFSYWSLGLKQLEQEAAWISRTAPGASQESAFGFFVPWLK